METEQYDTGRVRVIVAMGTGIWSEGKGGKIGEKASESSFE